MPGHGHISVQPVSRDGWLCHGEVVLGMFFEACHDALEVFDFVEEAFDIVALLAVGIVGNVRDGDLIFDPPPDRAGFVSLVGENDDPPSTGSVSSIAAHVVSARAWALAVNTPLPRSSYN